MPTMSAIERTFCQSPLWRPISERALRWSIHGQDLAGEVLEIGTGSGAMAAEMLRRFPAIALTTTDIDPAMVEDARGRLPDTVRVREADCTALPFPDASFDTVVSFLMLHHVIDWPAALAEIARVLRPGGCLLGYDLVHTAATSALHKLDGSPHRLIDPAEFRTECKRVSLSPMHSRPLTESAIVGQGMRFAAVRD